MIALAATSVTLGSPNLVLVLLAGAAGAFVGDQVAYWIGSRVNVRRVRFLQGRRAQRTLDAAARTLDDRGGAFIIAARYIPVGRVAVNMMAGTVGYPRRRFVPLTVIAAVTWTVYSALIGIGAGAALAANPLLAVVVGVVGGVLLGVLVDRTIHVIVQRREATAAALRVHAEASELAQPHALHAMVRPLGEDQGRP
ncbi:DedA family protein [Cellulomonas sp. P24]|uniref:DedA family protein n=1 Tax=Cellulomonas sp. P24 TaxID=2885206 RepID=UPI00216AF6E3|nr:VTT domain-containing protein [Cellulomonas sp. P24]MCR6492248.1 VTT domain-containing protein [Cellulomonas sp. P24]